MQDNKFEIEVKERRNSQVTTAVISAILLIIGGFFLSYNYIQSKKIVAYDYMSNVFYNGEEIITITEEEQGNEPIVEEEEEGEVTNDYIGYLTIPKINLTKGFLDKRSPENHVDKNILVVNGSNYPSTERGNFIVAGHSGTGWNAFFNDLYKLSIDDIAEVSYKGKKYTYKIVNIYTQPKVGNIAIYRDYSKTTLTLITCTNNDSTTQTIYIAELIKTE
ncbi:MAG: sortase [Bacilli bacterium]|nr:sortase [Bacilli bacterium]